MTIEEKRKRRAELRWEKDYKAYCSVKSSLRNLYMVAFEEGLPQEEILEQRSAIMSSPPWKAMSAHYRGRCMGILDVLYDIWENRLVWTHVLDGKRILAMDVPADRFQDINTEESTHAYKMPDGNLLPHTNEMRRRDNENRQGHGL